jgi:hypothetical protein
VSVPAPAVVALVRAVEVVLVLGDHAARVDHITWQAGGVITIEADEAS